MLLAFLATRHFEPPAAPLAGKVWGISMFAFVTIEIRHLWQGGLDATAPASDGEMATYSLIWLSMAVAAMLAGGMRYGGGVYRGGMALLLLTVLKVFLVDMSGAHRAPQGRIVHGPWPEPAGAGLSAPALQGDRDAKCGRTSLAAALASVERASCRVERPSGQAARSGPPLPDTETAWHQLGKRAPSSIRHGTSHPCERFWNWSPP